MRILYRTAVAFALTALWVISSGCSAVEDPGIGDTDLHSSAPDSILPLPAVQPVRLPPGELLSVVASTSIVGDVVAQVGGDAIELTTLMMPGQDPHGFEPTSSDMIAVSRARIAFVNGWELEAGLIVLIKSVSDEIVMVPVSADIVPIRFGGVSDPHVWMDPQNVMIWTENVEKILSALDPKNREVYRRNADSYLQELNDLDQYLEAQTAAIPQDRRKLVTNHDSLGYLEARYGFEVIATVIPAADPLAEPSARALGELVQQMKSAGLCTVYAESSANVNLAQAAAAELDTCSTVQVIELYTGAIGPPGSGADSYIGMMRSNIDAIVEGQSYE